MKSILIKGQISGRGIVNFDSNEQRFALTAHTNSGKLNENVKLGKKAFFATGEKKENGNEIWDYKMKISGDCLRHAIFEQDADIVNGALIHDDVILATYTMSPVGLMRGYMFVTRDDTKYVRKSPLTITDAIQTNETRTAIEVGGTTGERDITSFHFSEKTGDMTYEFRGLINLKQLQFVSADKTCERQAINSEWIDTDKVHLPLILKNHYGDMELPKNGYFSSTSKYTSATYAEKGLILSDEVQVFLVKKTLKNILAASIIRNNAYASVDSIQIKFVNSIIDDKMTDEDGWITLKTEQDVDDLVMPHIDSFYEEASDDDLKKREEMSDKKKELDEAVKKAKEDKKANKNNK